jgi:uncharacterized protein YaiE (UPF0345 family)
MGSPKQFDDVSVVCKASVYFNGGVVSHTLHFKDGSKKTIGMIRPGSYKFNTDAAELMQIVAGVCRVKPEGATDWTAYAGDSEFTIAAKSSFEIAVDSEMAEYVCSFLP